MVSASKMKKAQDLALNGKPYAEELRHVLVALLSTSRHFKHFLLATNPQANKELCVMVTTNKGLCGGLNTNHFRMINKWYKDHPNAEFISVGKKGRMFLAAIGAKIIADYSELPDNLDFADTVTISRHLIQLHQSGDYRKIYISYNQFISTLSQKPLLTPLLPIDHEDLVESLGLLERLQEEEQRRFEPKEYILEPNPAQIINWLLPYFVELQIYHFLLENKASEHSARMVAMKNASENAKEVMTALRIVYNRMRQQQVTMELADIVTASMGMASWLSSRTGSVARLDPGSSV